MTPEYWGEAIEHPRAQECGECIGMAEVGGEAVERVAQGAVSMEARKKAKFGALSQSIGLIGDRIVGEGSR